MAHIDAAEVGNASRIPRCDEVSPPLSRDEKLGVPAEGYSISFVLQERADGASDEFLAEPNDISELSLFSLSPDV